MTVREDQELHAMIDAAVSRFAHTDAQETLLRKAFDLVYAYGKRDGALEVLARMEQAA